MNELVELLKLLSADPSPQITAASKADVLSLAQVVQQQQDTLNTIVQSHNALAQTGGVHAGAATVLTIVLAAAVVALGVYAWWLNRRLRALEISARLARSDSPIPLPA